MTRWAEVPPGSGAIPGNGTNPRRSQGHGTLPALAIAIVLPQARGARDPRTVPRDAQTARTRRLTCLHARSQAWAAASSASVVASTRAPGSRSDHRDDIQPPAPGIREDLGVGARRQDQRVASHLCGGALVCQVVWLPPLRLVFGTTTAAAATTLAILLGGLGIGALVMGWRHDRAADPLRR